jgi:hypothetical protein
LLFSHQFHSISVYVLVDCGLLCQRPWQNPL